MMEKYALNVKPENNYIAGSQILSCSKLLIMKALKEID